jgi:hypothetical protein
MDSAVVVGYLVLSTKQLRVAVVGLQFKEFGMSVKKKSLSVDAKAEMIHQIIKDEMLVLEDTKLQIDSDDTRKVMIRVISTKLAVFNSWHLNNAHQRIVKEIDNSPACIVVVTNTYNNQTEFSVALR